ncbi:MAG: CHAT domain-containing protein [Gammaproteobacteria bacterium]
MRITLVLCAVVCLAAATPASSAPLREDVNADINVVRGLRALSQVQVTSAYPINQALAYDFFVPCLDYADLATGNAAQQVIRRDVERDTRNAVIDVFGKLDYHAAYKGRDKLRSRSLSETLELLSTQINDQSDGKNLGYLCAAATRFERVEVDFDAAARTFQAEYDRYAGPDAIFDLPLMRAMSSGQFWPAADARRRISAMGERRAASVASSDRLRAAFLYAYAALAAAEQDPREFIRLGDLALASSGTDRMAIEVLLFSRMRTLIDADAAIQLELLRQIFSRPLPGRRAAEMLPVDHVDRITHWATETYINLVPEHFTAQEYDAAVRTMEAAELIHSDVRDLEAQLAYDPQANTYTKRFLFLNYQTQDYRKIVGRHRIDLLRQMKVAEDVPLDIQPMITETILAAADGMASMLLRAYNPGYRDLWKYAKTEDIAIALVLYQRTGDPVFFDLAMFAVQATFLSLTDLSLRWQKIRAAANSRRTQQLAAEAQRLLFGFEAEMMQLLDYIRSVQVDDKPLSRAQVDQIHVRYRDAARAFNNRHQVLEELFDRMPAARQILAGQPPRLADIRGVLRPHEAVIYIARVDDDYLSFLVTGNRTRFVHTRDSEARVRDLVNRMIESLTPQPGGGYGIFDAEASHELYKLTIAPLEPDLEAIDKIVWIGPDALAGLSPEVYTDDSGTLLFERFTVTLNASLTDMVESHQIPASRRDEVLSVLAIGAPQSSLDEVSCLSRGECPPRDSGRKFRSAGNDNRGALILAPLPETVAELTALRDALHPVNATMLFGPDARVATVAQHAGKPWDVVAFATHGVPGERLETVGLLEPALLLGPPDQGRSAFLSTSDISAMGLGGRPIVVLSACDTARAGNGSIYFDSLSGFYQAFRLAGAKGVVATQWEVASDAAQRMIPDFVSRLRSGASFNQALRDAKIKLRDDAPPTLRHPGYWLPFVFLGDGGATL